MVTQDIGDPETETTQPVGDPPPQEQPKGDPPPEDDGDEGDDDED